MAPFQFLILIVPLIFVYGRLAFCKPGLTMFGAYAWAPKTSLSISVTSLSVAMVTTAVSEPLILMLPGVVLASTLVAPTAMPSILVLSAPVIRPEAPPAVTSV